MSPGEIFFWGFCGSVAVEILILHQIYQTTPINIPERYKRLGFWVIRFLLAVIAGGLAMAYDVQGRLLAVNIGASAPLIINALTQGVRAEVVPPQAQPRGAPVSRKPNDVPPGGTNQP